MSVDHNMPEADNAQLMTSRLGRFVYAVLGFVSLGLGIAGYVLPVLPGTVFLLLATFFFFRSSSKMYRWVMDHPRFGPTVRAYRAGYGIRRRVKVYAIALMLISVGFSIVFAVEAMAIRVLLVALAAIGAAFIITRPTTENLLVEA